MLTRRTILTIGAASLAAPAVLRSALGADKTVKIGNTMPYSGPASAYSSVGKADVGFFKWVNDQGGVNGTEVEFISLDDGYSPPRTVEDVRRLVEQDKVDFLFGTLGTPSNTAIAPYCNSHQIPQLFIGSGADKWGDYKNRRWTIGYQPSYRTEAQIYTKYMLRENPNARLALLYQNDDFGKDYPIGVRDILGKNWEKVMAKTASYEVTDPTIDSQIADLQNSGADALLVAATPKAAAQAIRKVHDLDWKPMFFMTNVAISVGSVMRPAGVTNGIGIISTRYIKDPTDPAWGADPGMQAFRQFMTKYVPSGDITDSAYVNGYGASYTMCKVLEACGSDYSRPNVMKQTLSLHDLENPVLLPGIKVNTSPTNYHPIRAMQLVRWDGKTWVRFGEVIEGGET
ncbi:MAG TPA: ABC transporter substrate-binding protein [Pirellulales bacterium]|nr:ABC transporter substrate-binding protein [Pirellulales bacterium]